MTVTPSEQQQVTEMRRMRRLGDRMFWKVSFHRAPEFRGAVHLSLHRRSRFGWASWRLISSCAVIRTDPMTPRRIADEVIAESYTLYRKWEVSVEMNDPDRTAQAQAVAQILGTDVTVEVREDL